MDNIKISLHIIFSTGRNNCIHYAKKEIEWPFPFPTKGDIIDIDDIEETFGELDYFNNKESKDAIQGNLFPFLYKRFLFDNGNPCIELNFGEGNYL